MIQRQNASMVALLASRLSKNRGEVYWMPIYVTQPGPITAAKDPVILATTGAGALAILLPQTTDQMAKVYAIKKIDAGAGTVDITAQGGDLIELAPVYQLAAPLEGIIIVSDGGTPIGNWWIISMI